VIRFEVVPFVAQVVHVALCRRVQRHDAIDQFTG
jgi:hypothetical protein